MKRSLLKSPAFIRDAKRFLKTHPSAVGSLETVLQMLADDAFQPALQTHKLKGDLAGHWAASAGYDLRVVFQFVSHQGAEAVYLKAIGTHDEVY